MATNCKDLADLIGEYNVMMSETCLPDLFRAVAQDAQDETVDLEASVAPVGEAAAKMNTDVARRRLVAWLNAAWLCTDDDSSAAEGNRVTLVGLFMWEMHTRIQKALIVSMILEGRNLKSFGAKPDATDIPQCLVSLWLRVDYYREHKFAKLKEVHERYLKQLPPSYVALYLGE